MEVDLFGNSFFFPCITEDVNMWGLAVESYGTLSFWGLQVQARPWNATDKVPPGQKEVVWSNCLSLDKDSV